MITPEWFTNGYPDPEVYRDQLRRRLTRLRRLYRIQQGAPFREHGKSQPYYAVYSFDIDNAARELKAMNE